MLPGKDIRWFSVMNVQHVIMYIEHSLISQKNAEKNIRNDGHRAFIRNWQKSRLKNGSTDSERMEIKDNKFIEAVQISMQSLDGVVRHQRKQRKKAHRQGETHLLRRVMENPMLAVCHFLRGYNARLAEC